MVFSSNIFLFIFLPVVLGGYFLINPKYRNVFLLISSLFFYSWGEPHFCLIMLFSILLNYSMGLAIWWAESKRNFVRRVMLLIGVVGNLGLLFYFKYLNFTIDTVNLLTGSSLMLKNIVLPIGISFFTFQGMTYVIDLYWKNVEVQKNPLKLGLYISFFPQLIAGPIVRYKDINIQLDSRTQNVEKFFEGVWRFVIGLGKKVIIANTVALTADQIFAVPVNEMAIMTAWLGIICYTFQIYFDFSGYSDMAIGMGKMFGFDFLENFNYPYISKSITEFWRRWHISLSSFFRDYVYIPLGGNRKGNVYVNLFIVFILTGLWHGASLNFLVWGLWNGLFILLERVNKTYKIIKFKIPSLIKHIYTMLIVVIGWVFFRANDLRNAVGYLGRMFGLQGGENIGFSIFWYLDKYLFFILLAAAIGATGIQKKVKEKLALYTRGGVLCVCASFYIMMLLFVCAVYVMTATYNPFIYFRF